MTDTRGAFRLKNVRSDILNNQYVPLPSVFYDKFNSIPGDIGYGHFMPGSLLKYNVTTTTVTTTSNSTSRYDTSGGGGQTHAYWSGGGSSPSNSIVSKMVYATEAYTSQVGSLPVGAYNLGVITDDTAVRLVGGAGAGSRMQKITLATDGIAQQPSGHYPQVQYGQMSFNGAGANGYFWGGTHNPTNSKVVKLTFASDTHSYIPSSMLIGANGPGTPGYAMLYWSVGKLGNTTAGYTAGGTAGGHPSMSTALKFTYSNETLSYPSSCNLPRKLYLGLGFTAGEDKGLYNSGRNSPAQGSTYYSDTHLLTFSNDSWATQPSMNNPTAPSSPSLNTVYAGLSGTSGRDNMRGAAESKDVTRWFDDSPTNNMDFYYGGGFYPSGGGPFFSQFFKITDSTDTHTQIGNSTVSPGYYGFAFRGNPSIGVLMGGRSTPSPSGNWQDYSGTEKITYSSGTFSLATPSTSTSFRRQQLGAFGPESTMIAGGGGPTPSGKSDFIKMSYSDFTWSIVPSTYFSAGSNPSGSGRQACHMCGNTTHGYIAGHTSTSPTHNSIVDKYTYSTDSNSATPARCVQTRYGASASSDTSLYIWAHGPYPYWVNGYVPKLTYATDTVEQLALYLPSPAQSEVQNGGSGNRGQGRLQNVGPEPLNNSYSYKWDYSTDTWSNSQNPSATQRSGMTMNAVEWIGGPELIEAPEATPTPDTSDVPAPTHNGAIWMGGYNTITNNYTSSGGKINFSNDVITMLPTTHLTGNRYNLAATSSSTAGYYGQAQTTQLVKILYANDTASTLGSSANITSGPASSNDPRRRGASFGLVTAGYWTGGSTGSSGNQSVLDKTTYSTDTTARIPGSNSPYTNYACSGASNQTAGYLTGGAPGNGQYVTKLTFSTNTWSGTSSPFDNSMWDAKTMSNSTHGFFIGGEGNTNGSLVYKLTFSNDSLSQLPSSKFPQYSRYGWGTGNSTHGYASGGINTGSITTRIYKLQYSNDTWSTAPNYITGGAVQQNAAAAARQNGNGDTYAVPTPNII